MGWHFQFGWLPRSALPRSIACSIGQDVQYRSAEKSQRDNSRLIRGGTMMPQFFRIKVLVCTLAGIVAVSGGIVYGQADPNSLPNPYLAIDNWAKMPEGRIWGQTSQLSLDRDGNVWVAERCGGTSCLGKADAPILEFDHSGKLVRSFAAGMLVVPHGILVDKDGNIWVTDSQGSEGKGHQVFKFSPDGKVLMTLGKAGVAGDGPDTFNMASAGALAPNGAIFIADGHGGNSNNRIVKFTKDGKFIKAWGKKGTGPGEFDLPHCLAFDSKGRLLVGDRNNNRIQVFDQEGNFIEQFTQFSRPSGIAVGKNDMIYVADSESESVSRNHFGWKRGIRV